MLEAKDSRLLMTHDEAIKTLNTLVKNASLKKHSLAVGACMKATARFLKDKRNRSGLLNFTSKKTPDESSWEVIGLLHDADYERTKDRPVEHGPIVIDEVRSLGYSFTPEESEAIKFHNFENTHTKESISGWALLVTCQLAGLIVAAALARPEKKLSALTLDSVVEKFNNASFAKMVKRDKISLCKDKVDIEVNDLILICLEAMQGIATDLGL